MAQGKGAREQIGIELPDPQVVEMEEQAVDEPERPEWLPENFNDPADLATAYREAQNKIREQGDQLSTIQQMLEEDRAERQAAQYQQQQQYQQPAQQFGSPEYAGQLREQLNVAFESDPVGTMAWLAQQYAEQTVQQRLAAIEAERAPQTQQQVEQQQQLMAITVDRTLGERYDDWGEYKEKVVEEIRRDPVLLTQDFMASPEATIRQLSRVYETVKARDVLAQAQNGNFVPNELSQMKRNGQTLSGQGSRPGEPDPADEHFNRLKAAAQGMSYSAYRDAQ